MLDFKQEIEQWGPIDGNVLYPGFWYRPMSGLIHKKWGVGWSDMIVAIRRNEKLTAWWDKTALEKEGIKAIEKWLLKPNKLKILRASYARSRDNLADLSDWINIADWKLIKPETGKKWYEYEMDFWNDATVFEIINYGSPVYLRSLLAKCVQESEIDQVLNILLAAEEPSFHKQSEIELWKQVVKAKNFDHLKKLVESYTKLWYWVDNSYLESKHISAAEFLKRIKGLTRQQASQKIKEAYRYYRDVLDRKKAVAKKYHLSSSVMRVARFLCLSLIIQDERKAVYWKVLPGLEKLCSRLAYKHQMNFKEVTLYDGESWHDLITTGRRLPVEEMKKRHKMTVFDTGLGRYKIYMGRKAEQIVKKFFNKDKVISTENLKGIGVSKGIAKGKVRILLSPKSISKLKIGEILVAPMTSPDFVVAMRKSKAVITDVGGMTSHAAVVSRELGVPCIVGTRIATKIFKDGDLVEVDAERGIVKLLKKSR